MLNWEKLSIAVIQLVSRVSPESGQIADSIRKLLGNLIQQYLYPALDLLRNRLTELVVSQDAALVLKCLELLDFRLRPLTGKDDRPPPGPPMIANLRQYLYVFS